MRSSSVRVTRGTRNTNKTAENKPGFARDKYITGPNDPDIGRNTIFYRYADGFFNATQYEEMAYGLLHQGDLMGFAGIVSKMPSWFPAQQNTQHAVDAFADFFYNNTNVGSKKRDEIFTKNICTKEFQDSFEPSSENKDELLAIFKDALPESEHDEVETLIDLVAKAAKNQKTVEKSASVAKVMTDIVDHPAEYGFVAISDVVLDIVAKLPKYESLDDQQKQDFKNIITEELEENIRPEAKNKGTDLIQKNVSKYYVQEIAESLEQSVKFDETTSFADNEDLAGDIGRTISNAAQRVKDSDTIKFAINSPKENLENLSEQVLNKWHEREYNKHESKYNQAASEVALFLKMAPDLATKPESITACFKSCYKIACNGQKPDLGALSQKDLQSIYESLMSNSVVNTLPEDGNHGYRDIYEKGRLNNNYIEELDRETLVEGIDLMLAAYSYKLPKEDIIIQELGTAGGYLAGDVGGRIDGLKLSMINLEESFKAMNPGKNYVESEEVVAAKGQARSLKKIAKSYQKDLDKKETLVVGWSEVSLDDDSVTEIKGAYESSDFSQNSGVINDPVKAITEDNLVQATVTKSLFAKVKEAVSKAFKFVKNGFKRLPAETFVERVERERSDTVERSL